MINKFKRAISVFTAMCFTLATFSLANPPTINAAENKKPRYLSEMEINATAKSKYSDEGKYSKDFYDEIIANYDSYTESSPLKISNAEQLAAFSKAVNEGKNFENKYIKLENDIDLKGTAPQIAETDDGTNSDGSAKFKITISGELENVWVPIRDFSGNFNGNNHEIKSMVALSNDDSSGFFRDISRNAEIKNIGITGNSYVVCSISDVWGLDTQVGGLVGYNYGSINNSYATVNVYCNSFCAYIYVGGLVGAFYYDSGSISNSYATGNSYASSSL